MKSDDHSGTLDLERDLPTTAEDVSALQSARTIHPLDLNTYLRFLASLPPSPAPDLESKPGPRGDRPFTLTE